MKKLTTLLASLSCAVALQAAPAGNHLPVYSLPDVKGTSHSSSEYQGKYVLVDFWATWCVTCRNVFTGIKELKEKGIADKMGIVSISTDEGSIDKVASFVKKNKIDWLVLHDPKNQLADSLGFEAVPALYFFGPDGKLIKSMVGYDKDKEKEVFDLVVKTVQ